jgi:5-methylcytosine-specific restriction endonuclease McrA
LGQREAAVSRQRRQRGEAELTRQRGEAELTRQRGEAELTRQRGEANLKPPSSLRRRDCVPAAVQRTVWSRDGSRCTYVDGRGKRCRETGFIELHHLHPEALGGPPTAENLTLRCKAHNALAAEQDFGRDFMEAKRRAGSKGGAPPRERPSESREQTQR